MKTLKTLLFLFLIPAFTFASPKESFWRAGPSPQIKKEQSKRVLHRTAVVIFVAHKKVKENHVYTGNLAKAVAHQKFARRLHREGKYFRAIHQSRRAKFLAVQAIKANKGAETVDMRYSKDDESVMKDGPSDETLDAELIKEMRGETMKDEDVIGSEPDINLKDND